MRADADRYAEGVRRGGEQYANQTLSDLVDLLTSAARTAENGRRALADRTAAADAAAAGGTAQEQLDGEWAEGDPESLAAPAELDEPGVPDAGEDPEQR